MCFTKKQTNYVSESPTISLTEAVGPDLPCIPGGFDGSSYPQQVSDLQHSVLPFSLLQLFEFIFNVKSSGGSTRISACVSTGLVLLVH